MPEPDKAAARKKFIGFLESKTLRMTAQRKAIIDAVFSTEEHFTAEQLIDWARSRDKSVSRATVYRTLPLLTESGLVREMDFGANYKYYDPNYGERPKHNHIICQNCGKIIEFESEQIEKLENEISKKLGFTVLTRRLQITAVCQEFERTGKCRHRDSVE